MEQLRDDELQHYGVIGMKWGVIHDPATAYRKASAKRDKLNNNVTKSRDRAMKSLAKSKIGVAAKYNKLQNKANKLQAKADKKRYGLLSNRSKYKELQGKADQAQYKADKYKYRAEKRIAKAETDMGKYIRAKRKAERWVRSMDKAFKNIDVSQLDSNKTNVGREYVKKRK